MIVESDKTTYRQLIKSLMDLSPERLDDNVTILDDCNGEFFAAKSFNVTDDTDVLDKGHFFITMQD